MKEGRFKGESVGMPPGNGERPAMFCQWRQCGKERVEVGRPFTCQDELSIGKRERTFTVDLKPLHCKRTVLQGGSLFLKVGIELELERQGERVAVFGVELQIFGLNRCSSIQCLRLQCAG